MDRFSTIVTMIWCGITRIADMAASRIHVTALPFMASRVLPECRTRSMVLPMAMAVFRIVHMVVIMFRLGVMAVAVAVAVPMLVVMVVAMLMIMTVVMCVLMPLVEVIAVSVLMIMTVGMHMVMRMIRMGAMGMIIIMIVRLMVVPVPMPVPMPVPVVMSVMMTMAVVMMVVPLAFAERIGPHQPIQIDGAHPLLQGMDTLVQHAGDLGLEAEIAGVGKADLRVLGRQIFHLTADALDERAGEQVVRHDDDLHHAQRHLIANHFL